MRSILIVDDNPAEQFLYKKLFQTNFKNVDITKAMNGLEALDTLKNCTELPSAILLDLNMPIMDGEEFLKQYKKSYTKNQIQIYLMADKSAAAKYKNVINSNYIKMRIEKPLDKNAINILSQNLNLQSIADD